MIVAGVWPWPDQEYDLGLMHDDHLLLLSIIFSPTTCCRLYTSHLTKAIIIPAIYHTLYALIKTVLLCVFNLAVLIECGWQWVPLSVKPWGSFLLDSLWLLEVILCFSFNTLILKCMLLHNGLMATFHLLENTLAVFLKSFTVMMYISLYLWY